jgi:hypothetical protein
MKSYQYGIVSCNLLVLARVFNNRHSDEAFALKHMPDLGHDVKDLKVNSWTITNWKKLDKKLTGPEFECGGHKWCVAFVVSFTTDQISTILIVQANFTLSLWEL